MKTGLLWFDADPQRALETKVAQAAQRYREKHGRLPDVCYVNPKALTGNADAGTGICCRLEGSTIAIRVVAASHVLLHHFWVGENGDQGGKPGAKQHP